MFPECIFDFVEALFEFVLGVMFGLGFFFAFDAYPVDDDVEERGGNDRDGNTGDESEGFVHAVSAFLAWVASRQVSASTSSHSQMWPVKPR